MRICELCEDKNTNVKSTFRQAVDAVRDYSIQCAAVKCLQWTMVHEFGRSADIFLLSGLLNITFVHPLAPDPISTEELFQPGELLFALRFEVNKSLSDVLDAFCLAFVQYEKCMKKCPDSLAKRVIQASSTFSSLCYRRRNEKG